MIDRLLAMSNTIACASRDGVAASARAPTSRPAAAGDLLACEHVAPNSMASQNGGHITKTGKLALKAPELEADQLSDASKVSARTAGAIASSGDRYFLLAA